MRGKIDKAGLGAPQFSRRAEGLCQGFETVLAAISMFCDSSFCQTECQANHPKNSCPSTVDV